MTDKIDSNLTGLRVAAEISPGVLPASPVWKPLEPNSYSDFGADIKTTARTPITQSRQRQKGSVTDLDAAAGFATDVTSDNLSDLLQGFLFADWRSKGVDPVASVTAALYNLSDAGGVRYGEGDLLYAVGFSMPQNNGLHIVTASAANTVSATNLTAEAAAPAKAKVQRVGYQFAAGDASITVNGGIVALASGDKDLTELGLIPGEWLFLGGDTAPSQFSDADNSGFVRVATVGVNAITFDKTSKAMSPDNGVGKSVQVFFGEVLKNEADPALINQRSYQFERSLGSAGYEYVLGAVANQLQIKLTQGDKVTADLTYVATDSRTAKAEKDGARPDIETSATAFNTSSDFSRLRVEKLDGTGLTNFLTEATITIANGVTPIKALGKLGSVASNSGDFMVSGSLTALFTDVDTIEAVRNNADVSMDFALVQGNKGMLLDVPLVSLGGGKLAIEKDNPIKIALTPEAAAHYTLNHTLLINNFSYLPSLAEG